MFIALRHRVPQTMRTYGFGARVVDSDSVADNFATHGTWDINGFEFYVYQMGTLTPSINDVRVSIYDGQHLSHDPPDPGRKRPLRSHTVFGPTDAKA
ncbi:MAG: hypothetical protein ABIP94_02835 [Planctomycetota bacterium]